MKPAPTPPTDSPTIALGDIYYIIFRHKWKIAICSIVGLLAAAGIYKLSPPPYHSEAKLFIRYVVADGKKPGPQRDDISTKSPDQGGETIMDSEQEILTSMDLARSVAEAVGPERILGTNQGDNLLSKAAIALNKGLLVEVPPRSSVIRISYTNSDKTVVEPVLRELIDRYLKLHLEIHRAVGMVGDFLTQETDQLKSRLAETEEELRKTQSKAGVVSVEQAKKAAADQEARIREEIFNAQTEFAERSAVLAEYNKNAASSASAKAGVASPLDLPIDEYRQASSRLEIARKREEDLLAQFTEENIRVKQARAQVAAAQAAKKKLEEEYPQLRSYGLSFASSSGSSKSLDGPLDPVAEASRLTALETKIKVLNGQLESIRQDAVNLDQIDGTLSELRRRKELEEANYRYYSASLEQSRIDEALGNGRVSNISEIQKPSAPVRDHRKTTKLAAGIGAAGIVLGLAWAFLIELYFDHSVRRPIDVERMLGLHLFLSIPALVQGNKKALKGGDTKLLQSGSEPTSDTGLSKELAPHNPNTALVAPEFLRPFHETLRDRLISYFESINLTHKPKLIAVTGLGRSAGVTTTAAGLAKSLSETGEGNVLLVDMTVSQGSAQQFYKGKQVCDLDQMLDTKNTAQVQTNLYVVADGLGSDKFSRALPQRFSTLASKLKASDFDYIIFDMPPVSQISITPRLAGFMDMVLLVLESEKTPREIVQRATTLLSSSKAHVGAVLNKTKTYVPKGLHEEYLGSI